MPSAPPPGDPAPLDGSLPASALGGSQPLGVYVHVPFCASRCGYCDFNTYTSDELPGVSRASYADSVIAELRLARRVLGDDDRPVSTVFVGGGTPTLLEPSALVAILDAIRDEFGLAADAEVTTEANPDSVTGSSLEVLRAGGFTRMSFGMQSAAPHVLRTLDRSHTPGRSVAAVAEARAAGFEHVSLDLIYGTPGETAADFEESLTAAVESGVDHVSAYALVVEDGTRMSALVRRGALPLPDDDVAADRYRQAERILAAAGLEWYEISNWSRAGGECRHNLGYWHGHDWWGAGPGAHSHVGGIRWWNVRHPSDYAARVADGQSPAQAREALGEDERRIEALMLGIRLRAGLPLAQVPTASELLERGLLDPIAYADGRAVLTLDGRLLADAIVRDLI